MKEQRPTLLPVVTTVQVVALVCSRHCNRSSERIESKARETRAQQIVIEAKYVRMASVLCASGTAKAAAGICDRYGNSDYSTTTTAVSFFAALDAFARSRFSHAGEKRIRRSMVVAIGWGCSLRHASSRVNTRMASSSVSIGPLWIASIS